MYFQVIVQTRVGGLPPISKKTSPYECLNVLFKRTSNLRESQGESLPIFEFLPLISKRKETEGKMGGWTRGRTDGWLTNFNELDCLMNFNALEKK